MRNFRSILAKNYLRVSATLQDPLSSGPVLAVSRAIYGNTAGFRQNLYGQVDALRVRLSCRLIPNPDYAVPARELAEHGITRLPGQYPPALVAAIGQKIEQQRGQRDEHDGGAESAPYKEVIEDVAQRIPELFGLVDERVTAILESYYRGYFQVHNVVCWRIHHAPRNVTDKREVFSNRWHCDSSPTSAVSLFVIPSDVTPEDGPMHVLNRQRTRLLLRSGFNSRSDYGVSHYVLEDPSHISKLEGSAGTAWLISTPHCFHRASIPAPGRRRDIIRIDLAPSTRPVGHDEIVPAKIYDIVHRAKRRRIQT